MAELQLHGGRAVVAAVLDALGTDRGLPPGGARRVHAPRVRERPLDLTQVEALADLIAETQAQRRQAFRAVRRPARRPRRGLARRGDRGAGLGRGRHRFFRRRRCAGGSGRPALAIGAPLRAEIAQRSPTAGTASACATGLVVHRGSAQCRQVDAAQPDRAARGRDRVALSRHDPRRDRGASRSRWLSGQAARHRRHPARATIRSSTRACAAREERAAARRPRPLGDDAAADGGAAGVNPNPPLAQMWRRGEQGGPGVRRSRCESCRSALDSHGSGAIPCHFAASGAGIDTLIARDHGVRRGGFLGTTEPALVTRARQRRAFDGDASRRLRRCRPRFRRGTYRRGIAARGHCPRPTHRPRGRARTSST